MPFQLIISVLAIYCCSFALSLSSCPDGWIRYHRSCYLFPDVEAEWISASTICHSLNSHLVEIETAAENNYLENILRSITPNADPKDNYWTGGNDIENESKWIWAESRNNITITDWSKAYSQPDNFDHHEDCLELTGDFNDHWNDAPCSTHNHFICEINLQDPEVNQGALIG